MLFFRLLSGSGRIRNTWPSSITKTIVSWIIPIMICFIQHYKLIGSVIQYRNAFAYTCNRFLFFSERTNIYSPVYITNSSAYILYRDIVYIYIQVSWFVRQPLKRKSSFRSGWLPAVQLTTSHRFRHPSLRFICCRFVHPLFIASAVNHTLHQGKKGEKEGRPYYDAAKICQGRYTQ